MKKIFLFLITCVFLVGFVFAAQNGVQDGTGPEHEENLAAGGQNGNPVLGEGIGAQVKSGETFEFGGKQLQIKEGVQNRIRIQSGESFADCDCNLTQDKIQNKTRLMTKLSNGKDSEIKIMPDTASETALNRLKLKVCSEERNCSIQLKEVGSGENARMAYELQSQRKAKFLGLFGTQMQVKAQVNAEDGEVISVKKPWWAFLASESE